MNGDAFYNAFKQALDIFDVPWGDKPELEVKVEGNHVVFSTKKSSIDVRVDVNGNTDY